MLTQSSTTALIAALLSSMVGVASCSSCRRDNDKGQATTAAALAPLQTATPTMSLPVSGFGDAIVAVPVGATRAMPVLVAVLGIGDTPEEQCAAWRDIVTVRAFVVCPRGAPNMVFDEPSTPPNEPNDPTDEGSEEIAAPTPPTPTPTATQDSGHPHQVGFYPVDVATLDREITASLAALEKRFGAYVATKAEIVYAGFSRGAFLGASLVAKYPSRFPRAILIEGGQTPWQAESSALFARGGGKRILFACGQPACVDDAETASTTLREHKIETHVVQGAGEGHGYKKQVKEELRRSFDWLIEGDAAWLKTPGS